MSVFGLVKSLAYISLPVFALHTLSKSSPVARYYARVTIYLSTLGALSVWGAIVSIGMNIFGDRYNVNWVVARSFYLVASRVMDIKLEVEGEEYLDTRPAILVGNHQSMLDILYLGRIFPKRASIMAKKELQWSPLLGQFMTLSGAVFVDRGNNAKAIRSLQAACESIKTNNVSLWMFPEGTRSMREAPDMLPFKKGAFHMAIEAGIPIVPVVCENYWRLYRKGVFETGTLKVKVLPPIPTTGLTTADVTALSIRVHDQMVEALRQISVPVPVPSSSAPSPSHKPTSTTPPPTSSQSHQSAPTSESTQSPDLPSQILPSITASGPDSTSTSEHPPSLSISRSESRASTTFSEDLSSPTSSRHGLEGSGASEAGTETEEDDGMVLVGRPRE